MAVVEEHIARLSMVAQRLARVLPANAAVPHLQQRVQEFAVRFLKSDFRLSDFIAV